MQISKILFVKVNSKLPNDMIIRSGADSKIITFYNSDNNRILALRFDKDKSTKNFLQMNVDYTQKEIVFYKSDNDVVTTVGRVLMTS